MSKPTATPTPTPEPRTAKPNPDALPQAGGSYTRQPDGTLRPAAPTETPE